MAFEENPITETYRNHLVRLLNLRQKEGNFSYDDGEGPTTIDEEINRIKTHIHRLETDHIDCVESCCPGCTMKGKNE